MYWSPLDFCLSFWPTHTRPNFTFSDTDAASSPLTVLCFQKWENNMLHWIHCSVCLCTVVLSVYQCMRMSGSVVVGLTPFETPCSSIRNSAQIPLASPGAGAARGQALILFPPLRPGGWHISQGNMQKEASEEGKENENKGTRQDANVNQNLEGKQVWGKGYLDVGCSAGSQFLMFPLPSPSCFSPTQTCAIRAMWKFLLSFPSSPTPRSACSEFCLQMAANEQATLRYLLKNT